MNSTPLASLCTRVDLRNLAIVAHVDHGKTTLVDALLRQSGAFRANEELTDRVMDSNDLEREKGITILAKNTSVLWGGVTLNIVDTPGHADFGGEVERALTMVDGIVLLVDAAEGPLPQTRFVLRKALAYDMPVILVINKVDRPDARISEVVDEVYELFMDLDAEDHQLDFPIVYCAGRDGWASLDPEVEGTDLAPLCDVVLNTIPAPTYTEGAPLQAWVTNLDANPYLGRLALCRVVEGTIRKGQQVAWCRTDGTIQRTKVVELYLTKQLTRVPVDEAGPGDLVAVAGIAEITIGETLADPDDPRPLPVITVDEPALSMTIGINTSPLAGRDGTKMTARLLKNRLDAELVGNVSIRVNPTDRPDAWEVQARGELQLAVLVETMRREGFELTVGKPEVVTRMIDGRKCEPVERVTIDTPDDYLGAVTQLLATRKGRMENMINHGLGWVRLEYLVPARGLIGFRTEFLTETRGTGVLSHIFEDYEPWFGEIRAARAWVAGGRPAGPHHHVCDDQPAGPLDDDGRPRHRGVPGHDRRRERPRRRHGRQHLPREEAHQHPRLVVRRDVKLTPHRELSLEHALEFIAVDECVEVTPKNIRLRKVWLDPQDRHRHAKRIANAEAS